jgi:DNA-binding MltR family transcriptional regulator
MTKTSALKKLSKRVPTPAEIEEIMKSLKGKDDIHVAIIAVSIVESTLDRLLVSRLHNRDDTFVASLFQSHGPMSDFYSKTLIAQAFGLLTTPLAEELHVMRDIRNAFAHAKIVISFEDAPVKQGVDKLKLVGGILGLPVQFKPELDHKGRFLLATRIVLIMMDIISKSDEIAAEVMEEALAEPSSEPNKK